MLQILIEGQDALIKRQDEFVKVQGALIKGQDALKEELAILREETRDGFKQTHDRLDKQGKQLAYLEDDAPTREEYDGLTKRVEKIEKVLSS